MQGLVNLYIAELQRRHHKPVRKPLDYPLGHALWMLHEMREDLEGYGYETEDAASDRTWDKFNRWLGFVQGVLWINGVYTIDEMRDQTRPLGKWGLHES